MSKLPDFIIIGAARSGTTALYSYLRQHPQIFMSPSKETNFFAFEGQTLDYQGPGADYIYNSILKLGDYEELFAKAPPGAVCGEASPLYMYVEGTAERIHDRIPDVRLVAMLRNPVEQAFSHYLYARRQMLEPEEDFLTALQKEGERRTAKWPPMFQYSGFPRYDEQLQRYLRVFSREQLQIHLYEDFEADMAACLAGIFRFVGVDDGFEVDFSYRPNAGGSPKNKAFQDFIMKPHWYTTPIANLIPEEVKRRVRDALSKANTESPTVSPEARAFLQERLHGEILALQDLIDRDLSGWLS